MSRNVTLAGSFLSLFLAAAALGATGCVVDTAPEDDEEYADDEAGVCATAPAWGENVNYAVGNEVRFGGKSYRCLQAHQSLPGWTPAAVAALWSETGSCAGSGGTPGGGNNGGGNNGGGNNGGGNNGGGSCNYPAWQQGKNYNPGDIVKFNGSLYIAEHANPGYDPTISTWFRSLNDTFASLIALSSAA